MRWQNNLDLKDSGSYLYLTINQFQEANMPIFEYRCDTCNCCFEKLILSRSEEKVECPRCSGEKVTKLVSAVNSRPNGIPTGSGGYQAPGCSPSGGG